ncbi:fatty acid--CoA ligase family protein [Mycobacterium sp. 050272]|uniref:class I adenylate-forming enzyme family protein n=1 Tax=Mycobacterium sp. 050272 TaxID=3142488 RepID=UPI0031976BA2
MVETLLTLLRARSQTSLAVVTPHVRWSTGELLERAAGAADWLAAQRTEGALHIPLLVPSGPDVLALTVAGAALGLPVAPLNPRSGPADLLPLLDPGLTPLVVVGEGPLADLVRSAGCQPVLLPSFPRLTTPLPVPADTDVVLVLHTSGTTGVPKRVPGRHRELVARIRLLAGILGLTPASIVTAGSPLHHIAGLGQLLVGLGAGSAVAPLPGGAAVHWAELAALGATHTILVPTMLHDLLERGALADAPLEVIQYGAAPMAPALVRRVIDTLPEVRLIQLYGQTEGSPLTWLDDGAHRAGTGLDTVGVALPGVELRLDGEEVVARAAHLFGAVDGAWLHTGDLGTFDEEGRLRLIGRAGDRIVRGGENVDPTEVEALISGHPSIHEVAIVGIPDERLGQRVRAYIVGDEVDFEEVRVWTRARTMGFKVPDEWVRIPELPRSSAGKVLRRALPM